MNRWAAFSAEALQAYEREASALGDHPAAAPLHWAMGRLWDRLGDPRAAARCFQNAHQLDPAHLPSLRAARELFERNGHSGAALGLCELEGAAARTDRAQADVARRRGVLFIALGQPDLGREAFEQGLVFAPEHLGLAEDLLELLEQAGDTAAKAALHEHTAAFIADPPVANAHRLAAAGLFEDVLGDPERALSGYEAAGAAEPTNLTALAGLERLYTRAGRLEDLVGALRRAAHAAPPEIALGLRYRLARILRERLHRPDEALAELEQARAAQPGDRLVLSELAALHEAAGRWPELAAVLRERAQATADPAQKSALALSLGMLLDERLGDADGAIASYRQVIAVAPGNPTALSALGKLLHKKGDFAGVLETFLAEAASASDPRQRAMRLYKAGETLEERLGRPDDAAQRYLEALEHTPGFVPAFRALSRIYERNGSWEELIGLLEREVSSAPDLDTTLAALHRIADLQQAKLGDLARAAATLQRALAAAPEHLPTLRALARVCERAERWREVIELNSREAALSTDQKAVLGLLHRNAEILEEQLRDADAALAEYKKLVALNPGYAPALRALGKLYRAGKRWAELVALQRMEAESEREPARAAALLQQAAEILEQNAGDVAGAEATYREVLSLAPGQVGALHALERLCAARSSWGEVAEVLRAQAAAATDPPARADHLVRAAEVLEERLGRIDLAALAYEEALASAPGHPWAARGLVRVLSGAKDRPATAAALERAAQADLPAAERAGLFARLSLLRAQALGDPSGALAAAQSALQAVPDHAEALALLEDLALAAGNLPLAAEARSRLADRCADGAAAAALRTGAARSLVSANDSLRASAHFRRALESDPADARAADAVGRWLHQGGHTTAEVEIAEARLVSLADLDERASVALAAAEACEVELGDLDRAGKLYAAALESTPSDLGALRGLRRCCEALARWSEAADLAEREGIASHDPSLAAEALARAAQLAHQELDDTERALRLCEQALQLVPLHPRASAELGSLREERGDHAGVVEFHEQRAVALGAGPAAAQAWALAARVRHDRLGDVQGARTDLDHALALDPQQGDALELSARMAQLAGAYGDALALYRRRIAAAGTPRDLAPARFAAAALLMDHLADPARAAALLIEGLAALPDDPPALERLASAAQAAGDPRSATAALQRLIALQAAPEARARHLSSLAALTERTGDTAGAAQLYEQLVELVPANAHAHARLAALYGELNDPFKQVKALETCAALASTAERSQARAYLVQAGLVYDKSLGNASRAILALRGALEADPDDVETRARLAELLSREAPTRAAAIEEHRAVLRRAAFRLESYHALFRLFSADKRVDAAWCAAAVLQALKSADEEEVRFYSTHRPPPAPPDGVSLGASQLEELLPHPLERGAMSDLFGAFGAELGKLYPPQPGTTERVALEHPLRKRADALARRLGGAELDLVLDKAHALACAVENTEPPSLVVGAEFSRRYKDREQIFLLARLVARVVRRNAAADRFQPAALANLCAAAVRLVHEGNPGFGKRDDELLKNLSRTLSRKARKALEEPAARVRNSTPPDFAIFADALRWTADRAGLLLCGDIGAAVMLAAKPEPAPVHRAFTSEELIANLQGSRAAAELLGFSISEEYLRLRESLGLALS